MFSTKISDTPDKKLSAYTQTHNFSGSNLQLTENFMLKYAALSLFLSGNTLLL